MWAVDVYLGVCGPGSAVSDVIDLVQATHQHFLLTAATTTRQPRDASVSIQTAAKSHSNFASFCLSAVLFDAPGVSCFVFRDQEQFGNH